MDSKKNKICKAIIPVAGLGTRMLPATKAIPKEMLPIVDKPIIQYIVNECVNAGIKQIILVTHSSKNSIENHFDSSFELELTLEKRVKSKLLKEIKDICPPDVVIMHVRQGFAKGLGHAIRCAYSIIGDEPVAIVLPDVLINEYQSDLRKDNLSEMLSNFYHSGHSQIMVEPVAYEDVSHYGIVDCSHTSFSSGSTALINKIIEKPSCDQAPSNLAVVGRYVLSAEIWSLLEQITPDAGGEIQLTDAISLLIKQTQQVEAYHIIGKSHDCGNKLGYLKAFVEYSYHHEQLGTPFFEWLKLFCQKDLSGKN